MDIQQKLDIIIETQKKIQHDIYQLKSMILRNQHYNLRSSPSPSQSINTHHQNNDDVNDDYDYDSDTDSENGIKVSPNLIEVCRESNIKYLNKTDQGQNLAWAPPKEPGLQNSNPILHNESK